MVASELSWWLWVCHLANVFQWACNEAWVLLEVGSSSIWGLVGPNQYMSYSQWLCQSFSCYDLPPSLLFHRYHIKFSPNCYELQNYWRTSYLPLIFLCFNLFLFPNLNVPSSQKDKLQKSKSVPVQLINFIFHVLLRPSHTHLISLNIYIYLFLAMLGLCCWVGFSLVKKKRGWFLIAVHRLLIAVASFVAEHGL